MATESKRESSHSVAEAYMRARQQKNAAKNRAVLMYSTAVVHYFSFCVLKMDVTRI